MPGMPGVSDGSANPRPVTLPDLFFRARCASPACKALLGGFHFTGVGGMVVFACSLCGRTTVFRNEPFGIKAYLGGPLVGSKACPAPIDGAAVPRTRGHRGGKGR